MGDLFIALTWWEWSWSANTTLRRFVLLVGLASWVVRDCVHEKVVEDPTGGLPCILYRQDTVTSFPSFGDLVTVQGKIFRDGHRQVQMQVYTWSGFAAPSSS